ncbi:MAG TPA: hypothetical protein VF605_15975 [Allosphingosinicella sp.]
MTEPGLEKGLAGDREAFFCSREGAKDAKAGGGAAGLYNGPESEFAPAFLTRDDD